MSQSHDEPRADAVPTRQLVGVALPVAPLFGLMMPTVMFMPAFYAEHVGLELGLVGTLFMVAKLWDMLSDPVFGYVAETVRLPFGRRRPWIVLSIPILLLAVYRIFLPPADAAPLYLAFWLFVFYLGWTMIFLTLLAWASELTGDYDGRSRVMGGIQIANATGMIGIMAVAAWVDRSTGGDAVARSEAMAWTVIVLLPVFVAITLWLVPERPAQAGPGFDFRRTLRSMWESAALRRLVAADLLAGLMIGVVSSVLLFYATHTLRLGAQGSLLLLVNVVSSLVFIPFWIRVSGRVGKDRTLVAASLYAIAAHGLFLWLPAEEFALAVGGMALVGLAAGPLQFLPRAILSDIIDETEAQGLGRHEAAFFALLTTTFKSGMAIAVGLGFYSLVWLGFDPGDAAATGSAESIRYVLFGYPAAFALGIAGLMHRFPLGRERHAQLRAVAEGGVS